MESHEERFMVAKWIDKHPDSWLNFVFVRLFGVLDLVYYNTGG